VKRIANQDSDDASIRKQTILFAFYLNKFGIIFTIGSVYLNRVSGDSVWISFLVLVSNWCCSSEWNRSCT